MYIYIFIIFTYTYIITYWPHIGIIIYVLSEHVTYIVGQARRPDTWHRTRRRKISSPLGIVDGWWLKKCPVMDDGWRKNWSYFWSYLYDGWHMVNAYDWMIDAEPEMSIKVNLGILIWMWLNPISIDATSLNKTTFWGLLRPFQLDMLTSLRCVCVFDVPPHLEGPSDWNLTNLKHGWFLLKMTSMVRIPWDPVFCPYIFGKIMRLKLSFGKSYKSWYCGKTNNKASPSHHQKWVV